MRVKIAVLAFAALALTSTAAFAMPNGIPNANEIAGPTSNVQQVRWICGPWGRCVWRPGWRAYAWGPGPVWGPRLAWGPRPVWGGAIALGPGVVWGPGPGWW